MASSLHSLTAPSDSPTVKNFGNLGWWYHIPSSTIQVSMPGIAPLMIFKFILRAGAYIRVGQVGNDNI